MKKTVAILIVLAMLPVFTACRFNLVNDVKDRIESSLEEGIEKNEPEEGDEKDDLDFGDLDLDDILNGDSPTDTVWGKASDTVKQKLLDEAKKKGYDLVFGADGSMTIKGDGNEVIQSADGTWNISGEDGGLQFGGEWPENEFTKLVPKPEFTLFGAVEADDEFTVIFRNVTVEEIKAYVEKVKANGFTVNPEETDESVLGVTVYSYAASNAAGYRAEIVYTLNSSGLTIKK